MGGGPYSNFSQMPPPGGAYPSYYQPYPSISPYEYEFNQIANRGGVWESESQNRLGLPVRWKFRSEAVRMSARRGRDLIGNRNAPIYRDQIAPILEAGGGGGGGGGQNTQDYIDALSGLNNGGLGFNLFDPVTAGELDEPEMHGVRLTLEAENSDGSGFELWGLWAQDKDNEFDARDDVHPSRGTQPAAVEFFLENGFVFPGLENLTGLPDGLELLSANLLNLRGIPLDDGTVTILNDGTTFGGASAVYDLDFQLRTDVETYGTGLRWKAMPIYKSDSIRIRPNAGFRYTAVHEHFGFFGRESGILYDGQSQGGNQGLLPEVKVHSLPNFFDDDGDGIVDNAGTIEDQFGGQGGGGGGGGAQTLNFQLPILNDPLYPITSILNNDVESHLAGPEVGFNYDFGGEKGFRLGGATNVGLLMNYQKIDLSGDNIFVTTRTADLLVPSPTNARPNFFESSKKTTSVSPMFEQMIYAEGPLFQYLPILRRSAILRNANFRGSYTMTVIAELTRATDSIIWQGNPEQGIFPAIETSRSTWKTQSWDFGVVWSW